MAIAAIFNKGSLQRGFYAGDFRQINIASKLLFGFGFEVKLLNTVSMYHHNPGFFRVGGIDQHFVSH